MFKKNLKKFLAGILSAAMVVGTMAMPAMASSGEADPLYLTNYKDTPYTTVKDYGTPDTVELIVVNTSNYVDPIYYSSKDEVEEIHWRQISGSPEQLSFDEISVPYTVVEDEEYAAMTEVQITKDTAAGLYVFEAENINTHATMDLSLVVNPSGNTTVSNVTVEIPSLNITEKIATLSSAVYPDGLYYPTVMDALEAAVGKEGYTLQEGTSGANAYVTQIEGNPDPVVDTAGWQFRVYDGETMNALSAVVGAGTMQVRDNQRIVWKYGSYSEDLFN